MSSDFYVKTKHKSVEKYLTVSLEISRDTSEKNINCYNTEVPVSHFMLFSTDFSEEIASMVFHSPII